MRQTDALLALRETNEMLREELRLHLKGCCIVAGDIGSIADSADRVYVRRLHDRVAANDALLGRLAAGEER